jgi:TPR repeat protein
MTSGHYDAEEVLRLFSAGAYQDVYQRAIPFAEAGVPDAQCMLALLYQLGMAVPQDGAKAVFWYERAASQGHPVALNNLGTIYFHGIPGIAPDPDIGLEYYKRAHASGFTGMDLTDIKRPDS